MKQEIFIGTDNVMKEFKNTSFNNQISDAVLLTCFTNTETLYFYNNNSVSTSYVVEASSNQNPHTGSSYSFEDPFKNTASFAEDNLTYPDYHQINIRRYEITTSGVSDFNNTFPQNNLKESQLSAAMTAFHMQELGHKFTIIIRKKEETELFKFCKKQNWGYFFLT